VIYLRRQTHQTINIMQLCYVHCRNCYYWELLDFVQLAKFPRSMKGFLQLDIFSCTTNDFKAVTAECNNIWQKQYSELEKEEIKRNILNYYSHITQSYNTHKQQPNLKHLLAIYTNFDTQSIYLTTTVNSI